ncbi:hypothetical protein HNQ51_002913 [Inhella inkyongensis]|uniref:Putative DNA-binding domain-containing protein n=2 Tax=Inhella inkyongensis TaxID=392593 RepID=A0A840S9B6_9BURK|nr:hypothetical protein [Inhella inkyongensis]
MTLEHIQAQFQTAVREGGVPPAGLLRGRLAERGLRAYQHAYPTRLSEALADNYGALAQALGDAAFDELARAYLQTHPPTEPSIRWFGHAMPVFMDRWADLPHPALADLARLDWALRGAFDAAEHPTLDPETLAALAPEAWATQILKPQPHVQLLGLQWAVGPTWHALTAARESGQEAELPEPEALAHQLLVWRHEHKTQWRSLEADEAQALCVALQEPLSLADWLALQGETRLPQAVAWLQRWALDGLLREH